MKEITHGNKSYETKLFIENPNASIILTNLMSSLDNVTLRAKLLKYTKENPQKIINLNTCIEYFNYAIEGDKGSQDYIMNKTILDNILLELKKLLGNEAIESFKLRLSLYLDNYLLDEILEELTTVREKSSNIIQFKKREN